MNTRKKRLFLVVAAAAALLAGGAYRVYRHPSPRRVAAHTAAWSAGPRMTARLMMERYGRPDALAPGAVTWLKRGPWKRIVVRDRAAGGSLEQTVGYSVPLSGLAALLAFGHGVRADPAADELSVVGDEEALNRLALNLAHDITVGRRTPRDAMEFYEKTARLAVAGKGSVYLTNLLFEPFVPATEDMRRRGVGYGY